MSKEIIDVEKCDYSDSCGTDSCMFNTRRSDSIEPQPPELWVIGGVRGGIRIVCDSHTPRKESEETT